MAHDADNKHGVGAKNTVHALGDVTCAYPTPIRAHDLFCVDALLKEVPATALGHSRALRQDDPASPWIPSIWLHPSRDSLDRQHLCCQIDFG